MRSDTVSDYRAAIGRAVRVAFSQPEATPRLLAEAAGFSAFHFSRMFRGMVGEGPGELLRRLRLERAAYTLCQPRSRVTEVAFEAGYESLEAFSRAFRAAFGCSPSVFPKAGLHWILPCPNGLHFAPDGRLPHFTPRLTGECAMNIVIEENVAPLRVVALRHVGPYPQIGPVFGRLMGWVMQNQVPLTGPALAIFHDDPETVVADALRSDACVPVGAEFTTDDPMVQVLDLPGGRYAVATHQGDYSGLSAAWGSLLGEWLPKSGQTIDSSRPCYELYLNDCSQVAPEDVRTELYEPIV